MAVPERKVSKSRKKKRRTHWKGGAPALTKCPKCDEMVLPHRVCPHCGHYRGRKVLETE